MDSAGRKVVVCDNGTGVSRVRTVESPTTCLLSFLYFFPRNVLACSQSVLFRMFHANLHQLCQTSVLSLLLDYMQWLTSEGCESGLPLYVHTHTAINGCDALNQSLDWMKAGRRIWEAKKNPRQTLQYCITFICEEDKREQRSIPASRNCSCRIFFRLSLECIASLQAKECVHGHKDKLRHTAERSSPFKSNATIHLFPHAIKNGLKLRLHVDDEQSGKCIEVVQSLSWIKPNGIGFWMEMIHWN